MPTPDPQLLWTVNSLMRKANDLGNSAKVLSAAGPHQSNPALFLAEATADQQEAFNCSARAHALMAGGAYSYPGDAVLTQLASDCQTLEQDIATSAAWATLIADAASVRQSMPASIV